MLELESRFDVQGRKLLVVGWFEGQGKGRIVVTGPNGEQEVVQVASLDVSLEEEVQEALLEPPPKLRPGAPVTAHLSMVTDGSRLTRSMELKGSGSQLDALARYALWQVGLTTITVPATASVATCRSTKARSAWRARATCRSSRA